MKRLRALLLLCVGCAPDDPPEHGLLGQGWSTPFPSMHHVEGGRLALDAEALPALETGPLPLERLSWREGFSVVQTAVVRLPGVDPAALPAWRDPTPGRGGVRLYDLDAGRALPVMAELDAWPDQADDARVLLVRPLEVMTPGHEVAVVITTEAAPRPAAFDALTRGEGPLALETQALIAALEPLGVAPDELALAWRFPIGDGAAPLRSALAQARPGGSWTFDTIEEDPDGAGPLAGRYAEGGYLTTDFLLDDRVLDLVEGGEVRPTGEAEALLAAYVPNSVLNAAPETVPVLLFGHGIFAQPSIYLGDPDDPSGLRALADRMGAIVIATRWRGLTTPDVAGALEVARDYTQFPLLGDRLVQGLANHAALVELAVSGGLFDDPLFQGASGQRLPRRGPLIYYGISLGAIEGATLMAQGLPLEAGVLHVGGAAWSTMLERSSNWPLFEEIMVEAVTDPAERQVLHAWSQLFWDPADPAQHVEGLRGATVLWQEALGDEQVPNLTTRLLARSVGVPQLGPEVEAVFGLEVEAAPLPPGSSAYVQLDPLAPLPPEGNRPAPVTGAHSAPRTWPGTHEQIAAFLAGGQEGTVIHPCGDDPCSADNDGR